MTPVEAVAAALFALALVHTFAARQFERLAHRFPRHEGLFHLLGEVEVVFGFWALVLVLALAALGSWNEAVAYVEGRDYTEPLFVFVVMVIAASHPVMEILRRAVERAARLLPMEDGLATAWLCLALLPLLGSLVTEPAAMTLSALLLAPRVFCAGVPEWRKYFALGVLFVNISIGGTLTSYAAPPVLMVADTWNWDSAFMLRTFGWKAALAVLVNASLACWVLRGHVRPAPEAAAGATLAPVPISVSLVHLAFLAAVVATAHHRTVFFGLFLFFLGFTTAYSRYQQPLLIREALLVAFFLAGLVVLGGMQQWWLQPLVSSMDAQTLFFGALGLTAVTDNAALTYLGSLIEGLSPEARYALVAGAVAGGGLTVIANAPNPAGVALLRGGFEDESIGAGGLLLGAAVPTVIAAAAFLLL
ncbi:MAG: putative Na+/H+ antiporter [Bradyrhizobium canariense]